MDSETDLKKKRTFGQIFNVFDDDGGGTATVRRSTYPMEPPIHDPMTANTSSREEETDGEIDFEEVGILVFDDNSLIIWLRFTCIY